jgi:citrate lyase subunit beta/citryl-CoA lyase
MNSFARQVDFEGRVDIVARTRYVATQQDDIEPAMPVRPRRSVLYIPGANARALEKGRSLEADSIILDLEDSVAPAQKAFAREQVANALRVGGYGHREIIVRINALDTEWGVDDIAAVAALGPDAILLPKVSTPGDIMKAARDLRDAAVHDKTRLWAMMETAKAILNADAISRTCADPNSRLCALVMGTNDLAKETRARLRKGRAALMPWIATCVAAARANGADIFDGVFGDIGDLEGFRAECEQGRDLGMDGKTIIHPDQIAICNEVFFS